MGTGMSAVGGACLYCRGMFSPCGGVTISYGVFLCCGGMSVCYGGVSVCCGGCVCASEAATHLRCIPGSAGRGGTRATAGTASLRPSRCSAQAAPSCTEGTLSSQGPGGPEGSTAPGPEVVAVTFTLGADCVLRGGLNEPWSRVAPPPQTRRRPAGGKRPAGTDLMRTLNQLRKDGRGCSAGRLLWLP